MARVSIAVRGQLAEHPVRAATATSCTPSFELWLPEVQIEHPERPVGDLIVIEGVQQ
jgi:hypothetical protein